MSNAKHTPGPWSYWPNCTRDGGMVTQDATATHIAAPTQYTDVNLTYANARLITAAPDLLAACQMVMTLRRVGGMLPGVRELLDSIVDDAEAAIAKATGEAK